MRRLVLLIIFNCLIFTSCDDGDIITIELEFDKVLELCGDLNSENYVVYDIRFDPNESLTLLFPGSTANDEIFDPEESPSEQIIIINGSSVLLNLRRYNGDPSGLICQEIPDSNVTITSDQAATSGEVIALSTFTDDDNDSIAAILEDINGNGDLEDDDTDGDGIPNYRDADDDNDNVLTKNENPDVNGDGLIDDAQDTDENGIPDYLDSDDDGDGTDTRFEDENDNGNLFDDYASGAIDPRFLDDQNNDIFISTNLNPNNFERTIVVKFDIYNTDLGIINADYIDFGTFTKVLQIED
ncbi:MAG: hypothetical protein KC469_11155 [Flavobacteriaceae bacterium]|nr:hypothetical protein [Flavobacteriaceae bacterium]